MQRVPKGNSRSLLSRLRGYSACYPPALLLFAVFLPSLCEAAPNPLAYECDDYRELIERLPSCSLFGTCFRYANFSTGCRCARGYSGDGVSCNQITCPSPTFPAMPLHGVVLDDPSKVYAPPDNARLGCESGYRIVGGEFIRCGWFGDWAAAPRGPHEARTFPTCEDVDECASGLQACMTLSLDGAVESGHSGVQSCTNTPGSFTCACKRGYANLNSTTCQEQTSCPRHASVANGQSFQLPKSFEGDMRVIVCNNGYYSTPEAPSRCLASHEWSHVECRDRDECAEGNHSCGSNQICVNTPGSYVCTNRSSTDVSVGNIAVEVATEATEFASNSRTTEFETSVPIPCDGSYGLGSTWIVILSVSITSSFFLGVLAMFIAQRQRSKPKMTAQCVAHVSVASVPNNLSCISYMEGSFGLGEKSNVGCATNTLNETGHEENIRYTDTRSHKQFSQNGESFA